MSAKTKDILDLGKLDPETRKNVERAARPRDHAFNYKFNSEDIKRWKHAAETMKMTMTEWVEMVLNAAAEKAQS